MKWCLSIEPWALRRQGVQLEENPQQDPAVFRRNEQRKREAVRACFPDVAYEWYNDERPPPVFLGHRILYGEAWGAELSPNAAITLSHPWKDLETVEAADAVRLPDIRALPGYPAKLQGYRTRAKRFADAGFTQGVAFGLGNYRQAVAAPLNTVLALVGDELFIRMYTHPELIHAYFRKALQWFDHIHEVKREVEGADFTYGHLSDCANTMLSPDLFEQFVLPVNQQFARRYGPLESHNCGPVTHLLEAIGKYGPFQYVEIGWGTELTDARRHFGPAMLLPRFGVEFMQFYTPQQAYDRAASMLRQCSGGPVVPHSNCIDAERTSEETLRALFSAAADVAA